MRESTIMSEAVNISLDLNSCDKFFSGLDLSSITIPVSSITANSPFEVSALAKGFLKATQIETVFGHFFLTSTSSTQELSDNKVSTLSPNQSTYIPKLTKHRLENRSRTPLIIIEIQTGSYFGEDDIKRFEDVYGRK